jgi:hypothetical protein
MYLQSIKSVKQNAANNVNRSILKKSRQLGLGVFIVHSSMLLPMGGKITHPWTLLVTVGQEGGFPSIHMQTPPTTHHSYTECISSQLQDIYDIVRIILHAPSFQLLARHTVYST